MMKSYRLAPLSEEPTSEEDGIKRKPKSSWHNWFKNQLPLLFMNKKSSNVKILLSVLGCPLFPLSSSTPPPPLNHVVTSSSEYIIEQYLRAATGSRKALEGINKSMKSMYAIGKVKMGIIKGDHLDDSSSSSSSSSSTRTSVSKEEEGCFVMWQMVPNKWLIELVVSGHKVVAGCDGTVAWRHTPWLGAHAAKGTIRPLRRALQGLDPVTIGAVFSRAELMGEKRIRDEDCFVLKAAVDEKALAEQSDNTADILKHVIMGYFSQRSGLLVHLEDNQLTRIQSPVGPGTHPTYWETTIGSKIEDYRDVDGVMIAHSGQSTATLTRFGFGSGSGSGNNNDVKGPQIMRMEERWSVDDVVFNVPGLSIDCFIPPQEVKI